jgi:hypothetical protein
MLQRIHARGGYVSVNCQIPSRIECRRYEVLLPHRSDAWSSQASEQLDFANPYCKVAFSWYTVNSNPIALAIFVNCRRTNREAHEDLDSDLLKLESSSSVDRRGEGPSTFAGILTTSAVHPVVLLRTRAP